MIESWFAHTDAPTSLQPYAHPPLGFLTHAQYPGTTWVFTPTLNSKQLAGTRTAPPLSGPCPLFAPWQEPYVLHPQPPVCTYVPPPPTVTWKLTFVSPTGTCATPVRSTVGTVGTVWQEAGHV
ncbi:MAG: hypothetical protein AAB152_05890 [Candidatus Coatesbacteria bacterium]